MGREDGMPRSPPSALHQATIQGIVIDSLILELEFSRPGFLITLTDQELRIEHVDLEGPSLCGNRVDGAAK
jgi:hypothetical protein